MNDNANQFTSVQNQPKSIHESALVFSRKGIPVFPIEPRGKKPVVLWKEVATIDQDQIDAWWRKNPEFNIGIPTGRLSGIVVIDFDTAEAWELAQAKGLPDAPLVKTGKGYHVYCRYQDGVRNFQKRADLPGIDLRGEGGLVVVPPSVHETGVEYAWVKGRGMDDLPLGEIPEWVLAKKPEEKTPIDVLLKGVPDGERTNALIRIAGSWIHQKMPYDDLMNNLQRWNTKNSPPIESAELLSTVNNIWKKEYGSSPETIELWKPPVLFEGVDRPEISADLLPSWLGDYARAVSQSTQTPEGLAVMVGLSAVATCVQKRFEVCPYGDDYLETLSIWTVTVLQSSERKTPVFKAMTAPIHAWEIEQEQSLAENINEINAVRCVSEKRLEKLRLDAVKVTVIEEREKLIREITEIQMSMPKEVRVPRLWTGDTTVESLQNLLVDYDERMSVLSDEGGIFSVMCGLYNHGKVNIDTFLQAYSGIHTRIKRNNRDVSLSRPALTFGITVQPTVIESFAYGSSKQIRGKGALGRFLFCIPESMLGKRDIGKRIAVSPELKARYESGIKRLLSIPKQLDEFGKELPKMLSLSDDALEIWQDFSKRIESMLGENGELSSLNDWGGKLPGNALRIAALLHLVEHGAVNLVIGKETLSKSMQLCDLFICHAKAAFDMIGSDQVFSGARRIYNWMITNSLESFSKTECHRQFKSVFKDARELDQALDELINRSIIRATEIPTPGKWITEYICNPILK